GECFLRCGNALQVFVQIEPTHGCAVQRSTPDLDARTLFRYLYCHRVCALETNPRVDVKRRLEERNGNVVPGRCDTKPVSQNFTNIQRLHQATKRVRSIPSGG